jgi:hypothetical protein
VESGAGGTESNGSALTVATVRSADMNNSWFKLKYTPDNAITASNSNPLRQLLRRQDGTAYGGLMQLRSQPGRHRLTPGEHTPREPQEQQKKRGRQTDVAVQNDAESAHRRQYE